MTTNFKTLSVLSLTLMGVIGCLNPHPTNRPPLSPEELAQRVENTAHLGATLAFQMESVKQYKNQVCEIIEKTAIVLQSIDDPNASFDLIRQKVLEKVFSPIENDNLRDAVASILVLTFNESFHYVETHYKNLLEKEKTKTVLTVSKAIAQGLKRACNGS